MKEITIASIYPITVGIDRPRMIPVNKYEILGVPENDAAAVRDRLIRPKVVVIRDCYEPHWAPITHQRMEQTITADEIANDFIAHATSQSPGMGPNCHPGVWICAGPEPTQNEIAYWQTVQAPFLHYLFDKGNEWASDPHTKGAIVWRNRMSAMALGREPEWLRPATGADIRECQYCTKTVPAHTTVCPHCNQIIDVAKYAELKAKEKEILKKTIAA
jgi:hypothetical protein